MNRRARIGQGKKARARWRVLLRGEVRGANLNWAQADVIGCDLMVQYGAEAVVLVSAKGVRFVRRQVRQVWLWAPLTEPKKAAKPAFDPDQGFPLRTGKDEP
jgi:hypothetical protein